MDTDAKKHIAKFFLLFFNHYAFCAQIWPFFSMYLLSRGASAETVGLVYSLGMICAILGSVLIGYIGDRISRISRMFLIILLGLLAAASCMWAFELLTAVLLSFYAVSMMFTALEVMLDAWSINSKPECGRYYGIMRSGGSIGYSLSSLAIGFIIVSHGFRTMFLSAALILTFQIVYVFILIITDKNAGKAAAKTAETESKTKRKGHSCRSFGASFGSKATGICSLSAF